jgi:hypothetical protein
MLQIDDISTQENVKSPNTKAVGERYVRDDHGTHPLGKTAVAAAETDFI